ncbi:MAG: non-homologous end-joining DNA ligase [Pyrinomonadaceae bacterium]
MASQKEHLVIGKRSVPVSNLEKLMYPGGRFTKAKVIDYYIRIAPYLLPHLKNRPVTLKRFPEGVFGEFFYEKDAPTFTPSWVKTFQVPRRTAGPSDIRYVLINDLPTLVWLANLANLEIHPFLHRVPRINRPTSIVFDCDPGEGANVLSCARVALLLRNLLRELGLESYAKVSGSKGLQVYAPLNSAVTYDLTQPFAKAVAELLAEREPKLIVSRMAKMFRTKKVFIDWSQNDDYKTTVSVYSLRAKIYKPFVSLPIEWDELQEAIAKRDVDSLYFSPDEAIKRVEKVGDLFADVLSRTQKLPRDFLSFLKQSTKRTSAKGLEFYERKRNFGKTREPRPAEVHRSRQGGRRRFVVQKHAASHLHYDFRLEMHGVLKSWAVPKGLSLKKNENRLSMATEDHPIEYLEFEGIIPQGQYGGGTVMVWDIGTYDLIEGNYYKGFLRVYLSGAKLKGEWTLSRAPDEKRNTWQLIKTDRSAGAMSKGMDDSSALTGRTMKQIREARDARWESNRKKSTAA